MESTCGWVGVAGTAVAPPPWECRSITETLLVWPNLLCVLLQERLGVILKVSQMAGRGEHCPTLCASMALIHEENGWLLWGWKENVRQRAWEQCDASTAKAAVLDVLWPLTANCLLLGLKVWDSCLLQELLSAELGAVAGIAFHMNCWCRQWRFNWSPPWKKCGDQKTCTTKLLIQNSLFGN